ncbi:uncharacterized protein LOC114433419 isoform X2 [Parambassis ranga]|uniref:Uncharacterized protein LOC114433419 isoform X2 n=1 Tax=Parambassis ranga TaxID=210632 RepID=A0A6P7I4K0_9TELE|nr:uncharacterized protein LOC114433419 isoform X2 [Parambassis ranga]
MDMFDEQLAEEVRRYEHLYNTSLRSYKDTRIANKSWKEIASTLCTDESVCRKKWRCLRDKFAKAKRRVEARRNADPGGRKLIPALYTALQWLDVHIKHRDTTTNTVIYQDEVIIGEDDQDDQDEQDDDNDEKLLSESLPVVSTSFLPESCPISHPHIGACIKRKRQTTAETEISSADPLPGMKDEDELFLLSLLPSLKRLTIRKRMEVRMKFQQVLYAAEFED